MTEARPVEKAKARGAAGSARLPSPPDHTPPAVPVPRVPPPPPPARHERPETVRTPKVTLTPGDPPPAESLPPWRRPSSDVPSSSAANPSSDVPSSSAANPLASMEAALGQLDPVVSLGVCLESGLGEALNQLILNPKIINLIRLV